MLQSTSKRDIRAPITWRPRRRRSLRDCSVFLAVGLAKAIELVRENKERRANHLNTLVDVFLRDLEMAYPKIKINSKNMRAGRWC